MIYIFLFILFSIVYLGIKIKKKKAADKNASALKISGYYIYSFIIFFLVSLLLLSVIRSENFPAVLTDARYLYPRVVIAGIFSLGAVLFEPILIRTMKNQRFRSFIGSDRFMYFVTAALAALIFCSIYGTRIIRPGYTEWIKASDTDLAQHYYGWIGYRQSSWRFPIGMTDRLAYPYLTSVIFTDSIPIMAVPGKLLSAFHPKDFQFFGLWGIMCFILQACFAAGITKNFSSDNILAVHAGVLFVFAPVMIDRMFMHTSLAGQWLILMALVPLVSSKDMSAKKLCAYTALLGFLTAGIHIYLYAICGFILIGLCLKDIIQHKDLRRILLFAFAYAATGIAVIWVLGGFSSQMEAASFGLGDFSANINSVINPMGWSAIFKNLPSFGEYQYEGFGWPGAGVLLLFLTAVILFFICRAVFHEYRPALAAMSAAALLSYLFALSPKITLGSKELVSLELPQKLMDLWAVFRSSGRFVWTVVYIIMCFSVLVLAKTLNRHWARFILLFALLLQVYDIHQQLDSKNAWFAPEKTHEAGFAENEIWEKIPLDRIDHLLLASSMDRPRIYMITDWALENGITMNDFYFARDISDLVSENLRKALQEKEDDSLFLFTKKDSGKCVDSGLNCYPADGMILGYADEIEGFDRIF